jgi:hypothetical protein
MTTTSSVPCSATRLHLEPRSSRSCARRIAPAARRWPPRGCWIRSSCPNPTTHATPASSESMTRGSAPSMLGARTSSVRSAASLGSTRERYRSAASFPRRQWRLRPNVAEDFAADARLSSRRDYRGPALRLGIELVLGLEPPHLVPQLDERSPALGIADLELHIARLGHDHGSNGTRGRSPPARGIVKGSRRCNGDAIFCSTSPWKVTLAVNFGWTLLEARCACAPRTGTRGRPFRRPRDAAYMR